MNMEWRLLRHLLSSHCPPLSAFEVAQHTGLQHSRGSYGQLLQPVGFGCFGAFFTRFFSLIY